MKASRLIAFALVAVVLTLTLDAQDRRTSRRRSYPKSPHSHNTQEVRKALKPLADRHRTAVVGVFCADKRVAFGVVVDAKGGIVTKASELEGAIEVEVLGRKKRVAATLVGTDEPNDLALLKIEAKNLTPAKFRANNRVRMGSIVTTITQDPVPIAFGVMSVGRHPRKPRPLLGVQINKVSGGIRLMRITRRSAAADAGLRVGDVVVAIDGKRMEEDAEFRAAIVEHEYGEDMKLRVLRDGKKIEVIARLKKDADRHGPISSQERSRLWGPLSDVRLGFEEVIQHDTVLTPEQCGSPIVDLDGRVVGLNIARIGRFETVALTAKIVLASIKKIRSNIK